MLKPLTNQLALLYEIEKQSTLIIADLHLGWEINLVKKGIHIPSQTSKIQRKLLNLIKIRNPDNLIILGDVKHTIAKAEASEWKDIPEFFENIKTKIKKIQIIRGNHDGNLEPLLPQNINLHPSTGIILDTMGLFHGHIWPSKQLLKCKTIIMGHIHPTVALRDNVGYKITTPVWIKAQLNLKKLRNMLKKIKPKKTTHNLSKEHVENAHTDESQLKHEKAQLIIMPCFNDFLGGRPINYRSKKRTIISPILRSECTDIENAEIYLPDGSFLGKLSKLRAITA